MAKIINFTKNIKDEKHMGKVNSAMRNMLLSNKEWSPKWLGNKIHNLGIANLGGFEDLHRELKYIYSSVFKVFKKYGIELRPFAGTLLGFMREGDIISHDDDMDFSSDFRLILENLADIEKDLKIHGLEIDFPEKLDLSNFNFKSWPWIKVRQIDWSDIIIGNYVFREKIFIDIFPEIYFNNISDLEEILINFYGAFFSSDSMSYRAKRWVKMTINECNTRGSNFFLKNNKKIKKILKQKPIQTNSYKENFYNLYNNMPKHSLFIPLSLQSIKSWPRSSEDFEIKSRNGIKFLKSIDDRNEIERFFGPQWNTKDEFGHFHLISKSNFYKSVDRNIEMKRINDLEQIKNSQWDKNNITFTIFFDKNLIKEFAMLLKSVERVYEKYNMYIGTTKDSLEEVSKIVGCRKNILIRNVEDYMPKIKESSLFGNITYLTYCRFYISEIFNGELDNKPFIYLDVDILISSKIDEKYLINKNIASCNISIKDKNSPNGFWKNFYKSRLKKIPDSSRDVYSRVYKNILDKIEKSEAFNAGVIIIGDPESYFEISKKIKDDKLKIFELFDDQSLLNFYNDNYIEVIYDEDINFKVGKDNDFSETTSIVHFLGPNKHIMHRIASGGFDFKPLMNDRSEVKRLNCALLVKEKAGDLKEWVKYEDDFDIYYIKTENGKYIIKKQDSDSIILDSITNIHKYIDNKFIIPLNEKSYKNFNPYTLDEFSYPRSERTVPVLYNNFLGILSYKYKIVPTTKISDKDINGFGVKIDMKKNKKLYLVNSNSKKGKN